MFFTILLLLSLAIFVAYLIWQYFYIPHPRKIVALVKRLTNREAYWVIEIKQPFKSRLMLLKFRTKEKKPPEPKQPIGLLLPQQVSVMKIITKDGKEVEYHFDFLNAAVDGIFFKSNVIDTISGTRRFTEGGDRISENEIIGIIKHTRYSRTPSQFISPDREVLFIRFLVNNETAVTAGQAIAFIGILQNNKE